MGESKEQVVSISLLKKAAKNLYASLQELKDEGAGDEARMEQVDHTIVKSRELFQQMKTFTSTILSDLEGTREQLNSCSENVLSKVTEQIKKVNESTEDAVQSVLNRVDTICEKQNDVFGQLAKLKSSIQEIDECKDKIKLTELTDSLEVLEGEIQMEAFEIMNEMQFQDVTGQQLQQANQLLDEARAKLTDFRMLLTLFKSDSIEDPTEEQTGEKEPRTFDPSATMKDRKQRQHLADEIESGYDD